MRKLIFNAKVGLFMLLSPSTPFIAPYYPSTYVYTITRNRVFRWFLRFFCSVTTHEVHAVEDPEDEDDDERKLWCRWCGSSLPPIVPGWLVPTRNLRKGGGSW